MITLTLPYPISANVYWRTTVVCGRASTYVSPEAKKYRKKVLQAVFDAGVLDPLMGRVAVSVQLFPHRPLDFKSRMRKHGSAWDDSVQCIDLDNANKVLLDSLKGVAIVDDKWVRELISKRMEPDGDARVVVRIVQLEVEMPQLEIAA